MGGSETLDASQRASVVTTLCLSEGDVVTDPHDAANYHARAAEELKRAADSLRDLDAPDGVSPGFKAGVDRLVDRTVESFEQGVTDSAAMAAEAVAREFERDV